MQSVVVRLNGLSLACRTSYSRPNMAEMLIAYERVHLVPWPVPSPSAPSSKIGGLLYRMDLGAMKPMVSTSRIRDGTYRGLLRQIEKHAGVEERGNLDPLKNLVSRRSCTYLALR